MEKTKYEYKIVVRNDEMKRGPYTDLVTTDYERAVKWMKERYDALYGEKPDLVRAQSNRENLGGKCDAYILRRPVGEWEEIERLKAPGKEE